MDIVNEPGTVARLLSDRRYVVPCVPGGTAVGLEWLRATVARFSTGTAHRRRRAAVAAILHELDPEELRERARQAEGEPATLVVRVLASALDLRVDPGDVVAVAQYYQPHTGASEEADEAVRRLVTACGGRADERAAALIGVLVQACEATALLVSRCRAAARGRRGSAEDVVAHVLRADPPVRATRRVGRDGVEVLVDLAAADLPFGAGVHACPGRGHAVAVACGAVERLWEEGR